MSRFFSMSATLGCLIGILASSCLEPTEVSAVAPEEMVSAPAEVGNDSVADAPVSLFPDTLGGKLATVTVVDSRQLSYRVFGKEQFGALRDIAPDARLFLHLQVGSAVELEGLLERLEPLRGEFPHVSVASFPADLNGLPVARKKKAFFASLVPLVRFHNEVIVARRQRLERLGNSREWNADDRSFVEEMCRHYRLKEVDTPLATIEDTLRILLRRADQIPPSLALTQAAIESGWGGSRFSRRGNNLFGQRVWDGEVPGMAPLEGEKPKFRLAVFSTIGASMRSYMRNLNTHPAYVELRLLREQMRRRGDALDPVKLAGTLQQYSTRRQEYVEDVIGFIEYNDLRRYDATPVDAADDSSF